MKMRSGRKVAESEHEEGRYVTEAAAALRSNGIAFVGTTESEQADGRLVVEAAAAGAVHHLDTDTNAAATDFEHEEIRLVFGRRSSTADFEHADGRIVVGAAAALDLDEDASTTAASTCALIDDTNAAAAIEKTKRRDVMSKSQEIKNEKTSEGNDEIRRLVEERRNTAKGEKHKLKGLSKRIKKCIRERKRTKRPDNRTDS